MLHLDEENTAPQISGRAANDDVPDSDDEKERSSLPVFQLVIIYLIQFAEPVTAQCVYPFVNEFVRTTGITKGDERKTGYYAGIIESAFFAAESLSVIQWGYLSDRYGRRPILLMAPLGLACSMFAFGMSTTFWPLVVARCFQGMFNGNVGVAKTMLAELSDSTNRADAFAYIPLMWSAGVTSGPLIGGMLSNPSKKWPRVFGHVHYLHSHPYFLPCAIAGMLSLLTFIIAFLFLKETLPSLSRKATLKKYVRSSAASTDNCENTPLLECGDGHGPSGLTRLNEDGIPDPPEPLFRDVIIRPIMLTILSHGFLAFLDMCNSSLLPLMWSTSIPLGGLGLDPFQIGTTLGIFGLINAAVQACTLAPVIRRYGTRKVFRVSFSALLFSFAIYPVMKYFAQRAGRVDGIVIGLMICQLLCQMVLYFAYGSIHILVVESIPEGISIGMTNGLAQMVASGMRAIAPTFALSLFSISLERELFGGDLVYYTIIVFTLIGIYCTSLLPQRPVKL